MCMLNSDGRARRARCGSRTRATAGCRFVAGEPADAATSSAASDLRRVPHWNPRRAVRNLPASMEGPNPSEASRSLRRVRWAQALVYSVLGLALIGTAFQSWRDVERVRAEVTAAQGRRMLFAVGRDLEWRGPVTTEALERAVRSLADDGLRCVVASGRGGEPIASAGDCHAPVAALQERVATRPPGTVLEIDGLAVLASDPPPPRGPHPSGPDGPPGRPPPPPGGGDFGGPPPDRPPFFDGPPGGPGGPPPPPGAGRPGPRPQLLVVYEPREANALRHSATRSLGVALVTVLALMGATVVLWRLARRAEELQVTAERDHTLVRLGEMSAVLAHEFRNPLAALKGHAQLLVERLAGAGPEREKAERLVRESRRLELLVDDLLGFVRASRRRAGARRPRCGAARRRAGGCRRSGGRRRGWSAADLAARRASRAAGARKPAAQRSRRRPTARVSRRRWSGTSADSCSASATTERACRRGTRNASSSRFTPRASRVPGWVSRWPVGSRSCMVAASPRAHIQPVAPSSAS